MKAILLPLSLLALVFMLALTEYAIYGSMTGQTVAQVITGSL
jgi:hypothetical protein